MKQELLEFITNVDRDFPIPISQKTKIEEFCIKVEKLERYAVKKTGMVE